MQILGDKKNIILYYFIFPLWKGMPKESYHAVPILWL